MWAQTHHLNQSCLTVNYAVWYKFPWKFNQNAIIFIQEMHLKMSSAKCWPFCPGFNVLTIMWEDASTCLHCFPHQYFIDVTGDHINCTLGYDMCDDWPCNRGSRVRLTKTPVFTIQNHYSHTKIEDSKMHILWCMGSKFCVKFQSCPLKFHTKFWTHTLQNMHFTRFE